MSLLLSNLVPEEQLTEFVESKDHMIILKVFKEFSEKEEVILPALYSLHSLAGPCKCIIESYFQFLISHSVHQLTSVCGNLSVIVKKSVRTVWELPEKLLFCFLWEIPICNFSCEIFIFSHSDKTEISHNRKRLSSAWSKR